MDKYLLDVEKYLTEDYQMSREEAFNLVKENKYRFKINYKNKESPKTTAWEMWVKTKIKE